MKRKDYTVATFQVATIEDFLIEYWLRKRNKGALQWKTKDGKWIPIKKLDDYHLCNIINTLLKRTDAHIAPAAEQGEASES